MKTAEEMGTEETGKSQNMPLLSRFLGTAVLEPGRFNPLGTFVAIYFLETGVIGLQLKSAAIWIEPVFYGAVLVAAVTISTLLHRRAT